MSQQCLAITKAGLPCKHSAQVNHYVCAQHNKINEMDHDTFCKIAEKYRCDRSTASSGYTSPMPLLMPSPVSSSLLAPPPPPPPKSENALLARIQQGIPLQPLKEHDPRMRQKEPNRFGNLLADIKKGTKLQTVKEDDPRMKERTEPSTLTLKEIMEQKIEKIRKAVDGEEVKDEEDWTFDFNFKHKQKGKKSKSKKSKSKKSKSKKSKSKKSKSKKSKSKKSKKYF